MPIMQPAMPLETSLALRWFPLFVVLVAVAGCDDGRSGELEADATSTGTDVETLADATVGDTSMTDGSDATASPDTTSDTGEGDTTEPDLVEPDTSDDMDADVVEPDPTWGHCPEAVDTTLPNAGFELAVAERAEYCRFYPEQRGLAYEFEGKAQLRIVPSVHALPSPDNAVESHALTLAACGRLTDGTTLTSSGAGTVDIEHSSGDMFEQRRYRITQPLLDSNGAEWTLQLEIMDEAYIPGGETLPVDFRLDGGDFSIFDSPNFTYGGLTLCEGAACDFDQWESIRTMNSCHFDNVTAERVARVEFEGGFLETTTRIGQSFASTEPAIFARGEGELDGVAFASDDYFELVYSPWHHHFDMDQAVRFDTPIVGEVCAVAGLTMPAWVDDPPNLDAIAVELLDCQFDVVETRRVTGYTIDRGQ